MRFFLPLSIVMFSTAMAEYETWTDKSGRTAEMELQSVSKNGDVNVGKFLLKNGTAVTLDASKLSDADAKRLAEWKPEITAMKAEGLKDGEISFSKKDVSRSHKDKAKIKTFQSFQFSMEGRNHKDPFVDSNNDKDLELNLNIESPYFPSGIESWELLSDGKPVKMLSDVSGSEIKVKFKYWTGIKEVKVLCEKTPDSKSSQPDPANPEEDSQ